MDRQDYEFPTREEFPPPPDELSAPREEMEFHPPRPESEFSEPAADAEASPPDPTREFTPPGSGGAADGRSPRRRRLRRLLYSAAALVCVSLIAAGPKVKAPAVPAEPTAPAATEETPPASDALREPDPGDLLPGDVPADEPDISAPPGSDAAEPDTDAVMPGVDAVFFAFSSEYHGIVTLTGIDDIRSVMPEVRDTTLNLTVWSYALTQEEIEAGIFVLPQIDAGDLYFEHMDEYNASDSFPQLELRVALRYVNGDDPVESSQELTVPARYEDGYGVSYWPPEEELTEYTFPGCFAVIPWQDAEVRFVVDDPDAVTDAGVVSVTLECGGRYITVEDCRLEQWVDEYDVYDGDGELRHVTSVRPILVIPLTDWMPEHGMARLEVTQYLGSTGERWRTDHDIEY